MSQYIDIHTHNLDKQPGIISVQILSTLEKISQNYFCYGIHPWDIHKFEIDTFKEEFRKVLSNEYLIGLGEIGLDKLKPDYQKQIKYFEFQLNFAVNNNINMIIIHCVKAYDDIYRTLQQSKYKGKILFHGFTGSAQQIKQFSIFDSYFSFGHHLYNSPKIQKSFQNLDIKRSFLETDDQDIYNIKQIYSKASDLKNISLHELKALIEENFRKVFIEPNSNLI